MQKKSVTLEYKKINKRRAENRLKRSLKYKQWEKSKNKSYQGEGNTERQKIRKEKRDTKGFTKVNAPIQFSFIKHSEEAIKFINTLEKLYLANTPTFINLAKVETLDHSAITVLASIARTYKIKKVKFNGKFPKNEQLKKLFIESDFFKYFSKPPVNEIKYSIGQDNQIFTTKDAKVNPVLGYPIMRDASKTIWNEPRTCKGLQRTLLELMQNANNHAKLQDRDVKHWWLSVNHNKDEHTVSFIFVDYGIGIFESLSNKENSSKWHGYKEKIEDKMRGDSSILKKLMQGDLHRTVTGKGFRGKGLLGIKQALDRGQISKLHVISNKVFADVSQNKYNDLPESFNGTFVYWELNVNNESSKWIE